MVSAHDDLRPIEVGAEALERSVVAAVGFTDQGGEPARPRWQTELDRWLISERVHRWTVRLKYVFMSALILWLVWQISHFGWGAIWRERPRSPGYYLLFLVMYIQLPLARTLVYRLQWRFPFWSGCSAMFLATTLNREFGGNTGEVYLLQWARRQLRLSTAEIVHTIKDFSIVSWICGTLWALALPCAVLAISPEAARTSDSAKFVFFVMMGVAGVGLAGLLHTRRWIFRIPERQLVIAAVIYLVRIAGMSALVVLQWSVALPGVAIEVWLRVLAMRTVIQWLPGIPNHQALICAAGISLSGWLGIPPEQLACLLLLNTALEKLTTLLLVTLAQTAAVRKRVLEPIPA